MWWHIADLRSIISSRLVSYRALFVQRRAYGQRSLRPLSRNAVGVVQRPRFTASELTLTSMPHRIVSSFETSPETSRDLGTLGMQTPEPGLSASR